MKLDRDYLVAIVRDITDRKQAEEKLRESETMYQAIFEATGTATLIIAEDTSIIMANKECLRVTGYSQDELVGSKWTNYVSPESMATALEYHKARRADAAKAPDQYEAWLINKEGQVREAILRVTMVPGTKQSIVSILDITDRKQTEAALRESEERLRITLEETQIGIWEWDLTSDTWFASPTYFTMLGYEPESGSVDREAWLDRVHPADREIIAEKSQDVLTGDKTKYQYEARIKHVDGAYRWQSIIGHTIKWDENGKPSRMIGVRIDIDENKRLKESLRQAQKMESVGRLAGGIAHDFNNILTAVKGYIDLTLHDLPAGGGERENLLEARYSAERAATLARQLLLFSRREPLELRPVNLNLVISDILKMLERLIGEQYSVVSSFDKELPAVMADVGQIQQVLMNLTVNARDAMSGGGVIEIGTRKELVDEEYVQSHTGAHAGEYASFYIKDSGKGIDAEALSYIFEPFFSTKDTGRGTGLGLSVVYGIIAQHGGWIDAKSNPGDGSIFTIFLPSVPLETVQTEEVAITTEGLQGHGEKILLVEDDEAVRLLSERMLSTHNYDVVTADSAEAALKIFEEQNGDFDLVFSDVILPGMNGIRLIERLIERKPELRVLLVSGFIEGMDLQKIRDEGYRLLDKPYALTDLLRQIRGLLGKA